MAFVAMVLVINFPVAGGILWTAYNLERIEPGASVTKRFHIVQDGGLIFSGEQSGQKLQIVIDSYVTNGLGGHKQNRSSRRRNDGSSKQVSFRPACEAGSV
jgi:hypothetical protein